MYAQGRGVPQNYVYARMWLNIVGSEYESFNEEMTPSQIEKAKELARACIRKQYKGCEV